MRLIGPIVDTPVWDSPAFGATTISGEVTRHSLTSIETFAQAVKIKSSSVIVGGSVSRRAFHARHIGARSAEANLEWASQGGGGLIIQVLEQSQQCRDYIVKLSIGHATWRPPRGRLSARPEMDDIRNKLTHE